MIQLFEGDADVRIRIEFRVATQCLGDTFVVIVQDGRKRSEQMRCEDGPLGIGQIKGESLDFGDGGHAGSVAFRAFRASA